MREVVKVVQRYINPVRAVVHVGQRTIPGIGIIRKEEKTHETLDFPRARNTSSEFSAELVCSAVPHLFTKRMTTGTDVTELVGRGNRVPRARVWSRFSFVRAGRRVRDENALAFHAKPRDHTEISGSQRAS